MAEIYYDSRLLDADKIYFNRHPYYLQFDTDLFSHKWTYQNSEYADKVAKFDMRFVEKKFIIGILESDDARYKAALKKIDNVFDRNVRVLQPGRLYCGEDYLSCYIIANEKDRYDTRVNKSVHPYTLLAENGQWIRNVTYATSAVATYDGLDYLYDYPYDYGDNRNLDYITNDTVAGADFQLTMYGPVDLPAVDIGDYHYGVDVNLASGEVLFIDSIQRVVWKRTVDNRRLNVFSLRSRDNDIFQKIQPGRQAIERNDDFELKLTMNCYRTMPEWWEESV